MHVAGVNPCAINNGGCAHLCLLSFDNSRNYTCACHNGTLLHQNGHDCVGKSASVCNYNNIIYMLFMMIHAYTGSKVAVSPVTLGIYYTNNSYA